jgi:hypothetical protein
MIKSIFSRLKQMFHWAKWWFFENFFSATLQRHNDEASHTYLNGFHVTLSLNCLLLNNIIVLFVFAAKTNNLQFSLCFVEKTPVNPILNHFSPPILVIIVYKTKIALGKFPGHDAREWRP